MKAAMKLLCSYYSSMVMHMAEILSNFGSLRVRRSYTAEMQFPFYRSLIHLSLSAARMPKFQLVLTKDFYQKMCFEAQIIFLLILYCAC